MFDPSQPPLISETLLKKRRSLDELAFKRSITVKTQNKKRRVVRGEDIKIKRPEQFVMEFRTREGSLNKMNRRKRQTERRKTVDVEKSEIKSTVGFVIRIHEGRHSSTEIKGELVKLGLRKKYEGVFFNLNEEGIARLKPLDSYVAYGYLTRKSVDELVHRRAHVRKRGQRTPLTDNITVETLLGEHGILCLNDLAHEIFSVGSNFTKGLDTLCPFQLSAPVGHFEKKILNIHDKIETHAGFIGSNMDEFLNKLL